MWWNDMVKKQLFNHREKIVYGGHALAIVALFGVLDTQLKTEYFSVQGKFIAVGLMAISLFTFHSFYKADYLRKVYAKKKSIAEMPPPVPPEHYKAEPTQEPTEKPPLTKPQEPPPITSKKIQEEFNRPLTKENKDIIPEVPDSLKPKPDHEKYDIPDLSEGIKSPEQLREEREAKKQGEQNEPTEVQEETHSS